MGIILDFEQPIAEIDKKINELSKLSQDENIGLSEQIKNLKKIRCELKQKIYRSLSSWQKIKIARHSQRPYFLDYVKLIFKDFMELHGDRVFGDDRSILCGIGMIDDRFVVIVGNQKGRSVEENIFRNFGMAYPEGYRKAIRVMKLAEKFNRPIVVFIDTPGAEPNIAAEERGQAGAIARNLIEMSNLKVPIISIIIGEGGSGGALGIGVSNKVLCLENAYYSVISPEGCASLIFKDKSMVTEAVEAMKITSKDLLGLKVIDEIIKEPIGGAHYDYEKMALNIKVAINKYLRHYDGMCHKKIVDERCLRFRNVGIYKDITNLKNKCKKTRKNKVFKKSKKK